MASFSAVATTGIYCRPGCPGRPDPRNVTTYAYAAAAEAAGYRPCHRCRPYRTELESGAVGSDLVCRAVRLILDGALDGETEAALGARLGISARHLRRLFAEHVGATPDQVARSRRAHFARRLLDDTDLTVTDIAFASGFGSVRQLNRACQEVFRSSPRELRARRRRGDPLTADGGLALRLPYTPPLDLDALLGYFAARAIPGVESVHDGSYRRTIVVDGDPGVLELAAGADDHVRLTLHLPHWEGLIHVVQRARRILNLDADVDGAARHLVRDPLVGPLQRARRGLRPPGTWEAFEIGVRAIVGQQVSVVGASTIVGRLAALLGVPVPGVENLGLTHLFPSADVVAAADLEGVGLTRARAAAVRGFAQAVAGDKLPLDGSVGLDELVASIAALPGLGPWTAHYIALRLGEPDAFPATDLGLRKAVGGAGANGSTPRDLSEVAEPWRPWRATAATHLWLSDRSGGRAAHPGVLFNHQNG